MSGARRSIEVRTGRFMLEKTARKQPFAAHTQGPKVSFKSVVPACYTLKMSSGIASGTGGETENVLDRRAEQLVQALGRRSIVLIGLMGSGKTSTGRRLAQMLGIEFADADAEIEAAAGMAKLIFVTGNAVSWPGS